MGSQYDPSVSTVALGLTVLLMPFPVVLAAVQEGGVPAAGIFLSDLPLAALVLTQIPRLRGLVGRRVSPLTLGWLLLLALIALAFIAHPSVPGAQFVLRCVAVAGIAAAVATRDRDAERLLVIVLIVSTLIQGAIGAAQMIAGGPLGLTALGEWQVPLDVRNDQGDRVPRGTMVHEYSLTVLALLTAAMALRMSLRSSHPASWVAPAALGLISAAFTYSRSALFAILVTLGVLVPGAIRRQRAHVVGIAALAAVVLVGAAFAGGQWLERIVPPPKADPEHVACGRLVLLGHGLAIAATAPALGVGPGRYVTVLRDRSGPETFERCLMTPHDVPLLFAAEDGVVAGVLLSALLVGTGWRALRSGPAATALFAAFAPFVVVDDFPFHVHGIVLAGLWLGMLERTARDPDAWGSATHRPTR